MRNLIFHGDYGVKGKMGCLDLKISKSVGFDTNEVGDFNVGENKRGTNVVLWLWVQQPTLKKKGRLKYKYNTLSVAVPAQTLINIRESSLSAMHFVWRLRWSKSPALRFQSLVLRSLGLLNWRRLIPPRFYC